MAIDRAVDRVARRADLLANLIRERGVRRYGLFSVTTEGKALPDGSEAASGYVVDDNDRIFFFWLDWDAEQGRVVFTDWDQVQPESTWEDDREYQEARNVAGLSEQ